MAAFDSASDPADDGAAHAPGAAPARAAPKAGANRKTPPPHRVGAGSAAAEGARWIGQAARRTSLTRRIVGLNLIGLGLLVTGVLILNDFRGKLIEMRTEALETQGRIIAIAIGESASDFDAPTRLDPDRAMAVLQRLTEPVHVRAQIFDRGGRLMRDTALAPGGGLETIDPLPPAEVVQTEPAEAALQWFEDQLRAVRASLLSDGPDLETIGGAAEAQEVYAALGGATARGERVNERGELIVSVSIPITRLRAVLGVLVLSTQGGDIDAIVQSERMSILQVFLVALATSIVLSVLLANAIARPLRKLAEAAEDSERGGGRRRGRSEVKRVEIPDFTRRRDEIGDLSAALQRMTRALYTRIEATEAFAADVAHEIKNPLTSLRSAVETMRLARTDDARERLTQVIEHDVARLDRLVTDISNASRLDAELVREAREPFDLRALLDQLVEYNADRARERGARLTAQLPAGPIEIVGLEGQIAQVFVNLIENAISFSPEGGRILVRLERPEGGVVAAMVEDDGPGIPDDNLGSIFERFYSERPDEESFGDHSGLGLSISRQIVDAHGGHIRAENRGPAGDPRRGARFVVELPG
ncbi:stimulus-sensing domain-containing protein [Rhodovulum sp. DZ06]|uniref:stimulus-sensing domain-containing protein n=1 Tax=Rhodovulum sp. DZ06 TaxID=3425126 RepID=UPI003D358325